MKRITLNPSLIALLAIFTLGLFFTSCEKTDPPYILQQEDITVVEPEGGFKVIVDQLLRIEVNSLTDQGLTYEWSVDGEKVATTKNLEYMLPQAGEYQVALKVTQEGASYHYQYAVKVLFDQIDKPHEGATAYITKVFDYMPAVGQFTNKLPLYQEGDTQEIMNEKVLNSIGNNNRVMISLGGYGGYVVVGFDHTIENKPGQRDFRVLGNAFYAAANPNSNAPEGGSCEAGIIMVAYDANKNGIPDENEWYEIAGSAHNDVTQELWYDMGVAAGNDMNFYYNDFEITYYKPESEPASKDEWDTYIKWEDNKGNSGYKVKNRFHNQPYYPLWATGDKITFKGSRLPQSGIDESGQGSYFVLYKFLYGYADNEINTKDGSAIDISWAINKKGQKVELPGVDFIKIYSGVNQENGWLGENSPEILGVEDLHILEEIIESN